LLLIHCNILIAATHFLDMWFLNCSTFWPISMAGHRVVPPYTKIFPSVYEYSAITWYTEALVYFIYKISPSWWNGESYSHFFSSVAKVTFGDSFVLLLLNLMDSKLLSAFLIWNYSSLVSLTNISNQDAPRNKLHDIFHISWYRFEKFPFTFAFWIRSAQGEKETPILSFQYACLFKFLTGK